MNPTISRLALRAVLGRRRGVLLMVLPLVLIALAVVVRALGADGVDAVTAVLFHLGLRVLLPLIALIAASSVLGPELDDGSIVYLLAKPISRHTIVASKLLVAFGCTVLFAAIPVVVAGLVLDARHPSLALAYGVGAVAGGAAYTALFAWLSTRTRHAVVLGLVYVLLWEGLVGGLLAGVRWVSITWWSGSIIDSLLNGVTLVSPDPGVTYAVVATVVVVALMTYLAGRRLQSFNLTGDE